MKGRGSASNYSSGWTVSVKLGKVLRLSSRFSGGASTVKGGEIFGHVVARVNENACDRCRLEPLAGVSVEGAMRRGTAARADRGGLPALLRAVAHSVHLQNMNAVSEAVQQGSG